MLGKRGFLGAVAIAVALLAHACTGDNPTPAATRDAGADGPANGRPCAPDQKACGGTCVPIDPAHGCSSAACTPCLADKKWASACGADTKCQCLPGFDNCDGDPDTGCERDVRADTQNCGRCKNTCGEAGSAALPSCDKGKCVFTCAAGYKHCSTDDSAGCETSLLTDPLNCGGCGRSCFGGGCSRGKCENVLLEESDLLSGLFGLARVGTALYGTNANLCASDGIVLAGLVLTVPTTPVKVDGGLPPPVTIVPPDPGAVADNSARLLAAVPGANPLLYFTIQGGSKEGIWRVTNLTSATPGVAQQFAATTAGKGPIALIAADAAPTVYYTFASSSGVLYADGGSKVAPAAINALVPDSGTIFVATDSGIYVTKAPLSGSAFSSLTTGAAKVLAVDAAYLYWANGPNVYRAPRVGGAPQALTPQPLTVNVDFLIIDDTTVFVASNDNRTLYRFPKAGGSAPLALGTVNPGTEIRTLAQDDKALYFTTAYVQVPPAIVCSSGPLRGGAFFKLAK